MRKITQIAGVLSLACVFTAAAQAAATETVLHNFPISPEGAYPGIGPNPRSAGQPLWDDL